MLLAISPKHCRAAWPPLLKKRSIYRNTDSSRSLASPVTPLKVSLLPASWILKLKTEKHFRFLPSTTSPFTWTTIYLWLLTEKQKASDLCLSDWGPRWELCCKKQWLLDVAFSWNDVTPALWNTHVTQMSAGLKFSCLLWVHSLCNFHPSSQFQWGFLKVRYFTRSP